MNVAPLAMSPSTVRRWFALVVVCLGQLMNALDATVVNVALPSIQHDLHFTQANLTWVVNGYLITFAGFLLLAGRLGDLLGRKRVYLSGVVLFTGASVACALAQDQAILIAARIAQGIGSAVSSSVIIAIIVSSFPHAPARGKAMSLYTFVAVSGGSIGLLVGGALTQTVNWHWIFFINLPFGLLALVLGGVLIEENEGIGLAHGVDVLGSILVTAAMMVGVYAIVGITEFGWASAHTLGFGGAALALLAAFLAIEARIANPILPLRLLRLGALTGSSAVRATVAIGMFTVFFLGTLLLEEVLRYSPTRTGLAFLPQTLATAAVSLGVTARLVQRFGPKRVAIPGLLAIVAGLVLLSRIGEHSDYFPFLFVAFLLIGMGVAITFMPLLVIAMADVPRGDAGIASGIVNASLQVAGAIGVAAMGTISADRSHALLAGGDALLTSLVGGYSLGFTVAAACVGAGLIGTVLLLRDPHN